MKFNVETGNDGPCLAGCVEKSVAAKRVQMRQGVAKMFSPLWSASVSLIPCGSKIVRTMLCQSVEKCRPLVEILGPFCGVGKRGVIIASKDKYNASTNQRPSSLAHEASRKRSVKHSPSLSLLDLLQNGD